MNTVGEEYLKTGKRLIGILQEFWDEKASNNSLSAPMFKTENMKEILIRYFSTLKYPQKVEIEIGNMKIKLGEEYTEEMKLLHVKQMSLIHNIDIKKFATFLTLPRSKDAHEKLSKLKEEAISLYTEIRDFVAKHYEKIGGKTREVLDKHAKIDISTTDSFLKKRKVEKKKKE